MAFFKEAFDSLIANVFQGFDSGDNANGNVNNGANSINNGNNEKQDENKDENEKKNVIQSTDHDTNKATSDEANLSNELSQNISNLNNIENNSNNNNNNNNNNNEANESTKQSTTTTTPLPVHQELSPITITISSHGFDQQAKRASILSSPLKPSSSPNNNNNNVSSLVREQLLWDPDYIPQLDKIRDLLVEVDEDENGEIDIEEFCEGMYTIDKNITKQQCDQIYNECRFTSYSELKIRAFIEILRNKCQPRPNKRDNLILVIRRSFPHIFDNDEENEDDNKNGQKSNDSDNNNNTTNDEKNSANNQKETDHNLVNAQNKLNVIKNTLEDNDEDADGNIDFPEFECAMNELGCQIEKDTLQTAFTHYLILQLQQQQTSTSTSTSTPTAARTPTATTTTKTPVESPQGVSSTRSAPAAIAVATPLIVSEFSQKKKKR